MMRHLTLPMIIFVVAPGHLQGQEASVIPYFHPATATPMTLRDPTQPSNFHATNPNNQGRLQVRSIIIGNTRRVALINDTFVHIGDRIGTSTVVSINKDAVVLFDAGRSVTLYLFDNNIRK